MKLTPAAAQALASLRGNVDFQEVLRWFAENEAKALDVCATQDGLKLYQAQGAVQTLRGIERAYADAPDTLKKFKQQPPSKG